MKKVSLVKYANEYFVTLSEFTATRATAGYSNSASVKSAVRTFVVKTEPNGYIAFRGEKQLKNIIRENRNNKMFTPDDFGGTRVALISFSLIDTLHDRFVVKPEYKEMFEKFIKDAKAYIAGQEGVEEEESLTDSKSLIERQLRQELQRIDKEIEVRQKNREKILQALNAVSGLELETTIG